MNTSVEMHAHILQKNPEKTVSIVSVDAAALFARRLNSVSVCLRSGIEVVARCLSDSKPFAAIL